MRTAKTPPADDDSRLLSPDRTAAIYREGEYWTIAYEDSVLRLRDSKGLRCLAHLLYHPGERVAAVDLLRIGESAPPTSRDGSADGGPAGDEAARVLITKRIKAAVTKVATHHPALGYHLTLSVKTGSSCVYLADPERPLQWKT